MLVQFQELNVEVQWLNCQTCESGTQDAGTVADGTPVPQPARLFTPVGVQSSPEAVLAPWRVT